MGRDFDGLASSLKILFLNGGGFFLTFLTCFPTTKDFSDIDEKTSYRKGLEIARVSDLKPSYGLVKACDRDLITLLGKWRQRMKWSDYQSSPLVWLGGSSPPLKIEVVGSPQNI